jgi:hypothetical protein
VANVPIGGIMFNPQAGGVYGSGNFTMSGGTISGNTADFGGGVSVTTGIFTMSGGTISGNSAGNYGDGVFVDGGTFTKTGGIIYGDTDNTHTPGSTTNTATSTSNPGTNGHAVLCYRYISLNQYYYYRNEDLTGADNISTTDTLPGTSGQTVGKWTKR